MKELITVWRSTRMVVLTGVSAALYVALMLPFKGIVIIPGFAEFRPGAAMPIVCSMLFGPAGAWGAGIGNVIGDVLGGMIGVGSLFGFVGNLLLGYVPYRLWQAIARDRPTMRRGVHYAKLALCATVASLCCGTVIGWGVHLLGFLPFAFLANVIALQDIIAGVVLAPPILLALYSRLDRMGLTYDAIMDEHDLSRAGWSKLVVWLLIANSVIAIVAGNLLCVYGHDIALFKAGETLGSAGAFGWQMLPIVFFLLLWVALL